MTTVAEAPRTAVASPVASSATAIRIFLTCWLIYTIHLATNTVREIYPALSLADHFSLRVDEYKGLHPDLFEKPGFGWHINSNPGASLVAAVPYSLARPLVDFVVARVNQKRAASGAQPPEYDSPWPMARAFYKEAWRRGLDIKFGLAALIIGAFAMAPLSAAAAALMFVMLRDLTRDDRIACWLALLYALGTPVFFRDGYLNQNQLVCHCVVAALALLWNRTWPERRRIFLAGVAAGAAVLMDYSGIVLLAVLALFVRRRWIHYALGCLGPLSILWICQWASFGNPFYPAQHWMAPVQWIDRGYQGVSLPDPGMIAANAFDYRYGLFTSCPLLLLAFAYPLLKNGRVLPRRQAVFCFAFFAALLLFAGSVYYSKLQFNTGVRYMVPAIPALFLPCAAVLMRFRRRWAVAVASLAFVEAWSMAMYRDVERGFGVLEPLIGLVITGPHLPALSVLGRLGDSYRFAASSLSSFVVLAIGGALIFVIWRKPKTF